LHTFDNEIHTVGDSNCKVVREEVEGKFVFPVVGNMRSNYSSNGCWDSDRAEFSVVVGIFVETEQIRVSEEVSSGLGYVALVNQSEQLLEVSIYGWVVSFD